MSSSNVPDLVDRALELSKADATMVVAEESSTANLRWASNTLTTNGIALSRSVTIIAMVNGKEGMATGVLARSNPDPAALAELVAAAESAARGGEPAEDEMPLIGPGDAPSCPDWSAPPEATSIEVFAGLATGLGEAFAAARGADRQLFGFAEHTVDTTYYGSSTGVRLRHVQPTGRLEVNAKSTDYKRSAWAGAATRDFSDVDFAAIDAGLTARLGWAERHIDLPAGRYETLLPPTAVADLMINAYWSAAGRDSIEGRTVYSAPGGKTRLGERLSKTPITMTSDPGAPGLQCCPFTLTASSGSTASVFDNGMAVPAVDWIRGGVLHNLAHTRWTAQHYGAPGATPGADNLIVSVPDPAGSLQDLIARTDRGLLLTCLWYIREVDPQTLLLTGLTRDGVYLVEKGEVVGAVNNFRFNESPVGLLDRLMEVGTTERTLPREWGDWFTRAAMPPVRVDGFNMSSVSEAQ